MRFSLNVSKIQKDNFEAMLEDLIQERKEARYQRYIEKRRKDLSDIMEQYAKIQKLLE